MFGWYRASLRSRPLITQCATTAVLFGTGDVMAQQLVEKVGVDKHNFARTGRMVGYGGIIFGPAATQWYKILTKIQFQNKYVTTGARVLADQTVFASCNLGFFLSSMAYMEGASPKARLESTYMEALKKNWMVWPAVQAINFSYVPLHHRVLVVNIVSLGWNCYLSFVNSQGGSPAKEVEEKVKSVIE